MTDPRLVYTTRDVTTAAGQAEAQGRGDARRAKGWKHTADFMDRLANTTVSLGFLAPLATWAFGVAGDPLSSGSKAAVIAVRWLIAGVVLHVVAGAIVRSFDLWPRSAPSSTACPSC